MSVLGGPGEGTWSVFAMQVVEERDRLRERVAELERDLDRIAVTLGLAEQRGDKVTGRASVEQMLDEIAALQRRMPTVDTLIRRLAALEAAGAREREEEDGA